jgi:Phosphotransferase enzyme family
VAPKPYAGRTDLSQERNSASPPPVVLKTRMPYTRAVSIEGQRVRKVQEPASSRTERLRTEAGRTVGQQTGLFLVPQILSFDDSRGEIVFERLQLVGFRQVLSDPMRSMDLAGRAAAALAAIHGKMEADLEVQKSSSDVLGTGLGRPLVPLHGDFGMRNIFYVAEPNRLAVIDWSNADWIGIDAALGEPEIDVAVFMMSLFNRRPFGPWSIPQRRELGRHFLKTYASASPHGLDLDALARIVAATKVRFHEGTQRQKGRIRALAYRHSIADLELFLRRERSQDFSGTTPAERMR